MARVRLSSSARADRASAARRSRKLSGWGIQGDDKHGSETRPRLRFYDNLDATTLDLAFAGLDLKTTRFVVTSKSGGTPETLVQVIAALDAVREAGLADRIPELFLGLTEPAVSGKANGLRALCEHFGIPVLDHDPGIGGRFSVLTNVGLLPALARGLDVERCGKARRVSSRRCSTGAPLQNLRRRSAPLSPLGSPRSAACAPT